MYKNNVVKVVSLILLVTLILLGVEYANYTDISSMGVDVSTGTLRVDFVHESTTCPGVWVDDLDGWCNTWISYENDKNINNNRIRKTTVGINNLYPGVTLKYIVKMRNVGTIPAKLKSIDVDLGNLNEDLQRSLYVKGDILTGSSAPVKGKIKPGGRMYSLNLAELKNLRCSFDAIQETPPWKVLGLKGVNDILVVDLSLTLDKDKCTNASQGQKARFDIVYNFEPKSKSN